MADLPSTPFDIILADPPWRFASNSVENPGKNALRHYPCMDIDDICALPVPAAKDALLLMWVTVPFAEIAFRVVKAWGFTYKSGLVWPKQRIGTGYWARNRHELVYICRRGKFPMPDKTLFPDSLVPGEQGVHSRKPVWLHERVEASYPEARKLEMFARAPRAGWTVWGNETTKFAEDVFG